MSSHARTRQDEVETAVRTPPAREAEEDPGVQLAGTIGNSAMQRVAESPALQRSPAAAPLAPTLARADREEELLGAQAYGGHETFLGGGGGEELMAHEVPHVVQQGAAAAEAPRAPREQPITPLPESQEPESAPEPEPESGAGGEAASPYAETTFSEQELEEM